jgi:fucose permease
MGAWSWFVYGLGATLVFLRDEQDSAPWLQGFHGTALAAGGIVGALMAPRFINRFGRGTVMRVGVIGTAVCISLFVLPFPTPVWTLSTVLIACFFGNLIVVCVNAFLAMHQGAASPAAFTESSGLAALMGLLAPVAIGVGAATVLGWRSGLLVCVVMFAVIEVWRGRALAVYGAPGLVETRKSSGALPRLTFWALFAGTAYIGAEFCISLWGASLLRERADMEPAAAAAGLGAFLGGVFIGRAFGSGLARRFSSELLLRGSLIAGLVTFALMWVSSAAPALLVAFFVTGIALSLAWPLSMSRILRSAGGRADRASSLALAFTTAAIGVAPFVLGGLAGAMPVHRAFLLVPLLLLVSLVLVLLRPVPEDVSPAQ